jgi:hypothetical protein
MKEEEMKKKNYCILLGLIAAMVLVFSPLAQAKEEKITLVNPVEKLDEIGRFQALDAEGGVLLVDTKTGRTWLYHRGNWHINPFVEGHPFPGDTKFAIISPEKKEKDE